MTLRKNIVITGASSGLGDKKARTRGRNLALCARRTDRLDGAGRGAQGRVRDHRRHARTRT